MFSGNSVFQHVYSVCVQTVDMDSSAELPFLWVQEQFVPANTTYSSPHNFRTEQPARSPLEQKKYNLWIFFKCSKKLGYYSVIHLPWLDPKALGWVLYGPMMKVATPRSFLQFFTKLSNVKRKYQDLTTCQKFNILNITPDYVQLYK